MAKFPGPGMHHVTCAGCKQSGFVYLEAPLPKGALCTDCVKEGK